MTIYSWSKALHTPTTLVEPGAIWAFEQMAHDCIEYVAEFQAIDETEKPLQTEKFLKADPTETEPWRSFMLRNTPGQAPAGAPVFLAQGTADTTVRPKITKQFGDALCKQGAQVELRGDAGVSHTFAARNSVKTALAWIGDRFRGAPPPRLR